MEYNGIRRNKLVNALRIERLEMIQKMISPIQIGYVQEPCYENIIDM